MPFDILAELRAVPLLPVLTLRRAADAVPLARALVDGGIRLLEITLRTEAAAEAAAAIAAKVPEAAVGLGTVTAPADLRRAREIGARFALSPGCTQALLRAAVEEGLPFIPGVATPSELMTAADRGFSLVKFFPAESLGGVAAIKSLGGPFPAARFCPTGGIGESNLAAYLALPNVVAVGTSALAPDADVTAGEFARIAERTRRWLTIARTAQGNR